MPRTAVLAVVGMACMAYGATAWFAHGDEPARTATAADARAKPKHQSIIAMRERMLKAYHGQTTASFTEIPGFGMERMEPLYKLVPFQIPDLSTNDVEIEEKIVPPEPLKDVFAKSLQTFQDPTKSVTPTKASDFGRDIRFGPGRFSGAIHGGLQLRMLDLVGLINADGPKVYSGGKALEIRRMTDQEANIFRRNNAKAGIDAMRLPPAWKKPAAKEAKDAAIPVIRPLDVFETTGVAELRDGKDLYIRTRGNAIRMLGALRATEQCLECHGDTKKGDLLGAFSYTFVDTGKLLVKEMQGKSAK